METQETTAVATAAQSNGFYQILLVDDDSTIRDNLREYLLQYHQAPYRLSVDEASTAEDAIDQLGKKQYNLVISDINLPDKDGFHILNEALQQYPNIKTALITAYDLETYIPLAKQEKVYNIITKSAPFDFAEFSIVVDNLLVPESAFGLNKYLQPNATLNHIEVRSSEEIMPAQEELKNFFIRYGLPDVDALSIVMVEAITNAVYHAPRNPDGSERYQKGQVIESLAADEIVYISYGQDEEKLGISIRDQGGSIDADEIMHWLERNFTGNSLMDTHGRGVFLIHRLMDRVVINLHKGKATELILLRFLQEPCHENKPLYINVVSNKSTDAAADTPQKAAES